MIAAVIAGVLGVPPPVANMIVANKAKQTQEIVARFERAKEASDERIARMEVEAARMRLRTECITAKIHKCPMP